MKTIFGKFLALALVMILAFGLAACGGGNDTPAPAPAPAPTADTPAAADPTPTTPVDTPTEDVSSQFIKDLGGRGIRITRNFDEWYGFPLIEPGSVGPDPNESSNYITDLLLWESVQQTYLDYNFHYVEVTDFGFHDLIPLITTSVLAGDPFADLISSDRNFQVQLAKSGLLIPFNDILPPDHDTFTTKDVLFPIYEVDGIVWSVNESFGYTDNYFIGVNLDIIHREGLPNPAELYDSGQWTFDAFLEIARRATRDTTGDGVIDQFGFSGAQNEIVKGFIAGNNGFVVNANGDFGYDTPATMHALEVLYQIWAVDKVWNDSVDIWDWNAIMFDMPWEGNTCMFVAAWWTLRPNPAERNFEYTAVPFPKGPNNPNHQYANLTGPNGGWVIPRGVENPYDVIHVYNEGFGWWFGNDWELRNEGLFSYPNMQMLNQMDVDRILDVQRNRQKFDLGSSIPDADRGGAFFWNFYHNEGTPAQVVEGFRQEVEDAIAEFFSND